VAALYRVMTDTWALRDVLEGLSPPAARLLWTLARQGEVEAGGLEAAAGELAARGLLHPPPEAEAGQGPLLADETGALCRRLADERRQGDRERLPLPQLVAGLDQGDLVTAAERWGVDCPPGGEPRATVEAALLAAVATPLALDEVLAGLERTERGLYEWLQAAGRAIPLAEVRRRQESAPALRRALRHLHGALLVWESWVDRERRLFVPVELRRRARRPGPVALTPVTARPSAWRHPYGLAWDLLAWLRVGGPAVPLAPTYPLWGAPSRALRPAYLGFLAAGATALELTAPGQVERWASQLLGEQQAAIVVAWRSSAHAWGASDEATTRAAVLDVLGRLTPGAWYPLEALAARASGARAGAAGRVTGSTTRGARRHRPAEVEPRLATMLLQTTLVWLGLLEPGREAERQRPVRRLTSLGAWLLAGGSRPDEPVGALVAEPSLRLLVYEVDAALLWTLLACASPEHLDRVSVFRLSRASVTAGLAAGLSGQAMRAALARAARYELPQNVTYSIEDWTRAARHAHLSRALILAFDDERARDEALALPALRALGGEPLPRARLALPVADDEAEHHARAVLHDLGFDGGRGTEGV
jgi:hypothetical protein